MTSNIEVLLSRDARKMGAGRGDSPQDNKQEAQKVVTKSQEAAIRDEEVRAIREEVREAMGMEAFGAAVDHAQRDLHLDFVAHLYPQLLDATKHLRYSKANPSELIIAKKNYKRFLTGVQKNATRLLESAKKELFKGHQCRYRDCDPD